MKAPFAHGQCCSAASAGRRGGLVAGSACRRFISKSPCWGLLNCSSVIFQGVQGETVQQPAVQAPATFTTAPTAVHSMAEQAPSNSVNCGCRLREIALAALS